ncbi:MAG: hypothetical protein AAGJ87_11285 [Pseudomonadota bacterium]
MFALFMVALARFAPGESGMDLLIYESLDKGLLFVGGAFLKLWGGILVLFAVLAILKPFSR